MSGGARAILVTAATTVALQRGGMTQAGPQIGHLAGALEAVQRQAGHMGPHDPLRPLLGPVGDVVAARLDGDENAYAEARWELAVRLTAYWGRRLADEVGT